jgi:ketosteroid isomerase-like protein
MFRRLAAAGVLFAVTVAPFAADAADDFSEGTLIALERAALDRWGKGDPSGYLELYAPEVTYFDPQRERRLDGLDQLTAAFAPIKGLVNTPRYDLVAPSVYRRGDLAVLSFNLVVYGAQQPTPTITRWNTTSVYALIDGRWKIVHHHFSLTKPQ